MEDTNWTVFFLNQRNAKFAGRKDILQKFSNQKIFRNNQETNLVKKEEKRDLDKYCADKIFNVYKLSSGDKQESCRINVIINSMQMIMEINTGASVRMINYHTNI